MIRCFFCNNPRLPIVAIEVCYECSKGLHLSREEVKVISDYLRNDYVPNEEPARSVFLKIHNFSS